MASIIKIKRSGNTVSPTTLAAGELAYSWFNNTNKLYIGTGVETDGAAANIDVVGGKYFTDMLDHTAGTLTASSAVIVDANNKIDNLKVDNLDLDGNTLSSTDTNGNISITPNGSGKTIVKNLHIGDSSTTIAEYIYDTVGGAITAGTGITVTNDDPGNTSTISITNTGVTAGQYGSATAIPVITVNAQGQVTTISTSTISTTLGISSDSGTDSIALGVDTLSIVGGEGIDTSINSTTNTLTIAAEDASSSNKGVASFAAAYFTVTSGDVAINDATTTTKGIASFADANFTVSSGAVSTKNITLGTSTLTNGSTTSSLAGLQQLDVDNIRVDGNTISSTNENGNIILDPNGSGVVDVSTSRIVNVSDPTGAQDAATKAYVDSVAEGLSVKPAVKAATTANLAATYDNGTNGVGSTLTLPAAATLTIDGITSWALYDGILVKDQTNKFENGRYYVSQVGNASTAWILTRCAKCDQPTEIPSAYVFVQEGAIYAATGWVAVVEDFSNFDVGVDDITWIQFSGAGSYLAGEGLSLTGSTFAVNVAANGGIEITSDSLQLKSSLAGNGLTYSAGVLTLATTTGGAGLSYTNGVLAVNTANGLEISGDNVQLASTVAGNGLTYSSGVLSLATTSAGAGLSYTNGVLAVNTTNGLEISGDNVQLASTVAGNGLTYTNGVVAVVGTADRISVAADSIDIASTYVGQTSITTLGTIATGTWSATTIATTKGGTGLTSYAVGDILYASAENVLSKLTAGTQGQILQVNSSGVPVWANLDGGTY